LSGVWTFACVGTIAVANDAHADPATTSPEQGYDLGQVQSPRAVAMAGANNATGVSTSALYLNPANMPLARVYHLEGLATFVPEARRQSYGAAIMDSILNKNHIAGGAAIDWSIMDPDGIHRAWTDIRIGLAMPVSDRLSIGAVGRYLRVDQAVAAGPLGASYASDGTRGNPLYNQITFDAGATAVITDQFRFGVVGHNLTNPGTALAPTTIAGGLGFISSSFAAEANGLVDFTTFGKARLRGMIGGEAFVADRFALRIGYRYDDGWRTHALTGGLGYIDKKWSFEVGASHDIIGDHPATFITLSIRYFQNAASFQQDEPDAF
jgi:hypothetical protein